MKKRTFEVGIDLGNVYAKISGWSGDAAQIIRDSSGATETPCAIWLNPRGEFVVGRPALEAIQTDDANVHFDFIRQLGTSVQYTLPPFGCQVSTLGLAAELLKRFRANAAQ